MPQAARALAVAVAVVLAAAVATGAAEVEPVSPDRTSITNNAVIVPPGALQVETGAEYQRARSAGEPATERFAVPALVRLGLSERLEVRLSGEPLVRLRGPDDDTGFGDLTVSLKGLLFNAGLVYVAVPWLAFDVSARPPCSVGDPAMRCARVSAPGLVAERPTGSAW